MRKVIISFTESDFREISKRAFNLNQSEEDWIFDQIQEIIQDVG